MSEPEPVKQLGYKLVGDNIDKGVKTRFMRAESHRNQSLLLPCLCHTEQNRFQ